MKHLARIIALSLFLSAGTWAQPGPVPSDQTEFNQAQLDQMLAPIALYPDPLLSQVLMASTYPLEVVEADRWSRAHPDLRGDAAVRAVERQSWDPSVKSLVAFPQILHTMDDKLEWTEQLGDAFLAQQDAVMDTVQQLRHKARDAGNLSSNDEVTVQEDQEAIDIEPARPDVVYVPYYDPTVVYGSWWWPDYPPTYWSPWDGYGWRSGYAWGPGFIIGGGFFFGGWDWRHHGIWIRDHRHWFHHHDHDHDRDWDRGPHAWHHDPGHRRGVPYHNADLDRRFDWGRHPTGTRQLPHGRAPAARVPGSPPQASGGLTHPPRPANPPVQQAPIHGRPSGQQPVSRQPAAPVQQRAPSPQRAPVQLRNAPVPQRVPVQQHAPMPRPPMRQPDPPKKIDRTPQAASQR